MHGHPWHPGHTHMHNPRIWDPHTQRTQVSWMHPYLPPSRTQVAGACTHTTPHDVPALFTALSAGGRGYISAVAAGSWGDPWFPPSTTLSSLDQPHQSIGCCGPLVPGPLSLCCTSVPV